MFGRFLNQYILLILGVEPVSVDIHNYGAQTCNQVVIHYSVGGEVCSETISTPIVSGGSLSYTFNQLLNLQVPVDTLFNLVVWVATWLVTM